MGKYFISFTTYFRPYYTLCLEGRDWPPNYFLPQNVWGEYDLNVVVRGSGYFCLILHHSPDLDFLWITTIYFVRG